MAKIIKILILFFFLSLSTNLYSQLTITSPSVSDTVFIAYPLTISWSGSGGRAVNIEYSQDHGLNWNYIATGVIGNSYTWQVPYLDSVNVIFRVSLGGVTKPSVIWEINDAHEGYVLSNSFSPDGSLILSAGKDNLVKVWDISQKQMVEQLSIVSFPDPSITEAFFFHSPDSVIVSRDTTAVLWDRIYGTVTDFTGGVFSRYVYSAPHPFRPVVACGSLDGWVRVFDLESGTETTSFLATENDIRSIAFSEDGSLLIYPGENGEVLVRNWEDNSPPVVLSKHGVDGNLGRIWSCKVSPDGVTAASCGVDNKIILWDISAADSIYVFRGHNFHVRDLKYSPRSNMLLTGSLDSTIRQWDILSGKEIDVAVNHGDRVLTVDYSPTSDSIISGGRDNDIRLWKNFEAISEEYQARYKVRYKAYVNIPDLESFVGAGITVPLEYIEDKPVAEIQSRIFNAAVDIEVPNRLLHVSAPYIYTKSTYRKDTVSFLLEDVSFSSDTLTELFSLVLQGDTASEEIRIIDFRVLNDSLFAVGTNDGSITVETYCKGLTNRKVLFDSTGREMTVFPNPVENNMNIAMGLIEDGYYCCELVNLQGKTVKKLFVGEYRHGSYGMSFDVSDLRAGVYLVRLKTPTRILTKRALFLR